MAQKKYFSGDTVRVRFSFYDYSGDLVDPVIVKVIFYDSKFIKIEEVIIGAEGKVSVGNYYYDYISNPLYRDILYYEIYGEVDGKPSISRSSINFSFI